MCQDCPLISEPWDNIRVGPEPPHVESKRGCRPVRDSIRPTSFQISEVKMESILCKVLYS